MPELDPSDQWKLDKWGKFSASEIHKLMVPGPMDKKTLEIPMFGEGALTYIKRVARECYTIFNEEESPQTYAMKMGVEREADGAGCYIRFMGIEGITYYGVQNPVFFPYGQHAGVSPDTVLWMDLGKRIASFGAEGKNPTQETHDWNLDNIRDQHDLKKHYPDYYAQCQFSMMAFNCTLWHWYSHNLYFKGKERILVIEVEANKDFQNSLSLRLKKAIKLKQERIENHQQRLTRLV
jgi:hypothetical protein